MSIINNYNQLRSKIKHFEDSISETLRNNSIYDVGFKETIILQFIKENNGTTTVRNLVKNSDNRNMSYLLNKLEKIGYLSRETLNSDNRTKIIELTEKGKSLTSKIENNLFTLQ